MDWLKKYTFPAETSFQDIEAARHRYSLLVKRFLANGTTTAMYYGSLHLEPNTVLVDTIEQLGQRAVVGKVSWCPGWWLCGWGQWWWTAQVTCTFQGPSLASS